jgi:hypothetical protein
MKNLSFFYLLLLLISSCTQLDLSNKYNPNLVLNKEQQDSLTFSLIRYLGKMPSHASDSTKFNIKFDEAYSLVANEHNLIGLHQTNEDIYFLYTRLAPSLEEKYVAIAGIVKRDGDKIIRYEEVFRTWKQKKNELYPLAFRLFSEMISGKDLSVYYPENSGNKYIIEFPSNQVYFDKEERKWKRRSNFR